MDFIEVVATKVLQKSTLLPTFILFVDPLSNIRLHFP